MGSARKWFNTVRKKFIFIKTSETHMVTILHSPRNLHHSIIREATDFHTDSSTTNSSFQKIHNCTSTSTSTSRSDREDIAAAAIKIQSIFRGHLARRAYRALRSLVKLQAVGRGVYVRKQAQIALQCMHVLVRLQVRVRLRQLLNRHTHDH